jgi:hypothetical protein
MALLWLPVDDRLVDGMTILARSSWAQEDLDATWRLTSWPEPNGHSLAGQVFGKNDYDFMVDERVAERPFGLKMSFNPNHITGFMAAFAVFDGEMDRTDPDALPADPRNGWQADASAGRARFDEVWAEGCQVLETRLGPPQARGTYFPPPWNYAAWRMGPRLVMLLQGENILEAYTLYDLAYFVVADYPAETAIPVGDAVFDFLMAGRWAA